MAVIYESPDGTRRLEVFVEDDGRRRVVQSITTSAGEKFQITHDHPDILTHPYFVEGVDAELCLHQGEFFRVGDTCREALTGDVRFIWTPTPHILARGSRDTIIEDFEMLGTAESEGIWRENPLISFPDGAFSFIESRSVVMRDLPDKNSRFEFSLGSQEFGVGPVDRIRFLIPNGWHAHGGASICGPDDLAFSWPGRLEIAIGAWALTIDRTRQAYHEQFRKELSARAGRAITHIGEVRRTDGNEFLSDDVEYVLETLRVLLTFAVGRRVNPVLPVGWRGDVIVWSHWTPPPVDRMKNADSWLDPTIAAEQISSLLVSAGRYCATSLNQSVIKYAISYYVSANVDVDVEPSISLAISGLQLLAHHRFVNERQVFASSNEFESVAGNTENQVRMLLVDCNIDTSLPPHFEELGREAQGMPVNQGLARDALGAAVYLRNKIVHPAKTLPSHWNVYAWAEASILVRHFLRLAILHTLGYQGQHKSALSLNRWVGSVDPVPWSQP